MAFLYTTVENIHRLQLREAGVNSPCCLPNIILPRGLVNHDYMIIKLKAIN